MICGKCGRQPISLGGFLLKPQVVKLDCRHCGARLTMPASVKWMFAGWVTMTVLVLRYGSAALPLPHVPFLSPEGLLRFLGIIIVPAAMLAMVFRLIIWRREYACGAPRRPLPAEAGQGLDS